ncbi:peptidoglycan DD-metalloendopeptidase family protein [bacterium]|nr:peptidoglycan DD-metalloendopeptidase family protein [bacterium]MCI0603599.1 peptidoglycan DD-metalloendopeptidase family protein [bacterium]
MGSRFFNGNEQSSVAVPAAGSQARRPRYFVFAVAAFLVATELLAQEAPDPSATPDDSEEITLQKLETIQKEISALRQEANRLSTQENSVLAQLAQHEVEYKMKTHEIELLELRQTKTEGDIQKLQATYQEMEKSLQKQKEYLTRRLVEAYKLGELNYLKLLLRANQSADLLRSYQYIAYLAKDDSRKVQNYRASMVDLEQTRLRLEQEKRNLDRLRGDLQGAHDSLEASRQEKLRLLSSIRDEKSMHLNAMSDLRVAANQLQQFFAGAAPVPVLQSPENLPSLMKQKGALDWPVSGRITRQFGVYRHPRFGTTTMSNGVEISAPEGTDVRAVFDGQVVFAEWFKGYGQSVILSHSDGYYTLYAHNSELLVQRGQIVHRAQNIARVGSTGVIEGNPSLYFEIRKKDQPVNPREWLRRR